MKIKYKLVIHPDTKVLGYFKKSWEFIPIVDKIENERSDAYDRLKQRRETGK